MPSDTHSPTGAADAAAAATTAAIDRGDALYAQGKWEAALGAWHGVVHATPTHAPVWIRLARTCFDSLDSRRVEAGIIACRNALTINSRLPEAWRELAVGLGMRDPRDAATAATACEQSLALDPESAETRCVLAGVRIRQGRFDEAERLLDEAAAMGGDTAIAAVERGNLRLFRLDFAGAQTEFQRALGFGPFGGRALLGLFNLTISAGLLDAAHDAAIRSVKFSPFYAPACNALATALQSLGQVEQADAVLGHAERLAPYLAEITRNRLRLLMLRTALDPAERLAQRRSLGERFGPPRDASLPAPLPAPRLPGLGRRLRIGYLSSDFRCHPVARNLEPLLRAHDRSRFEIVLYAEIVAPDPITTRFQALADVWRSTVGLGDAALAAMIRDDGIDVLVCLAGWFDRNRPLVCAYRPAPVQISFHDAATSGLEAMDYLITDRVMSPRSTTELFTERLIRLPSFYLAEPLAAAPAIAPPPVLANGSITFGCLNSPTKLGPEVLALWARLLGALPDARLNFKYRTAFQSAGVRGRILEAFTAAGIDPSRLAFLGADPGVEDHIAHYNRIDIALDPFPFCGSTTTFEALTMGVPVVTLPMDTMVSRWSAAMLTTLGLTDLVARSPEHYQAIAVGLAADVPRLARLRSELRERLRRSPLCDARLKARHMERVYGAVWRRRAG